LRTATMLLRNGAWFDPLRFYKYVAPRALGKRSAGLPTRLGKKGNGMYGRGMKSQLSLIRLPFIPLPWNGRRLKVGNLSGSLGE
jgi:hypothetical protein